nr:N-acetylmuramoyl-L-alanine amidase [Clostridium sp. D53t1_180928_C8]
MQVESKVININKLKILSLLILSGILITPSDIVKAEGIYNVSESELIKLLEKYKDEEVKLEDGLVLTVGEAIDLPVDDGWTIYNENVAEIVNGELVGKAVGSTFVSQQTDDTVHILEVCISESGVATNTYVKTLSNNKVKNIDRDYYKVFIDPGHGGYDNGAVQNGVLEDEISLQISQKIEAKLKAKGVQVKMSRYDDTYVSLTDRTRMANNWGSDLFVSIHQNSATASSANGIETYHYPSRQDSKELATEIQSDLIQSTNAVNRGVKSANYAVIRTANMSSSLVECGFVSNPTEARNLSSSSYQDKIAEGIANGIMDYLANNVIINNSGGNGNNNSNNGNNNPSIATQSGTIKVNGALNVRSGAGTSYSVVGSLSNGSKVEIVETTGTWYKIKYGSGYGYVSKDYVTVSTDSGNNGSSTDTQSGTIKVNGALNVRSGAGTSYSVVGSLSNGSKVEIVETSGTWYKIKYGNGTGYVSKDYVVLNTRIIAENTVLREGTSVTLSLKVRDESNYDSNVIGSIAMGKKIAVLEHMGEWSKIQYKNNIGYILNEYVDFNIV